MECVIPLFTTKFMGKRSTCQHKDLFLSEYSQFDDYLEMVIQFGVIMLGLGVRARARG